MPCPDWKWVLSATWLYPCKIEWVSLTIHASGFLLQLQMVSKHDSSGGAHVHQTPSVWNSVPRQNPEGRRGKGIFSCYPPSGISSLSFDPHFYLLLGFFCLVFLHFLSCHYSASGPFSFFFFLFFPSSEISPTFFINIEYKLSLLCFQILSHQAPHLPFGTSSPLHSFPAAPLFCRHLRVQNTILPLSLTRLQLSRTNSPFLSVILPLSVLSNLPRKPLFENLFSLSFSPPSHCPDMCPSPSVCVCVRACVCVVCTDSWKRMYI